MIEEHCVMLSSQLSSGQQFTKSLFALLCAERLRHCCWAFGKEYNRDVSSFAMGCDLVFSYIITDIMSDDLRSLIDVYAATIHSTDEIGSALAVQAQYGMLALMNALELCQSDDIGLATSSGIHVIDAIDNYELFAWTSVPSSGEFKADSDYWLLRNEVTRQRHQADQVTRLNKPDFIRLRIENRQYAIPPAVL